MCGGAIISDFIPAGPASGARRVTADILWPSLRKRFSKPLLDDDFEAGFREFKDDSEIEDVDDEDDEDEEELKKKPFGFSRSSNKAASKPLSRGINNSFFVSFWLFLLLLLLLLSSSSF